MGKSRLTTEAKNDLSTIREYTKSNWGLEQSNKYIIGLRNTLDILSENPSMGVKRDDIEKGIYSFPYTSHIVYYMLSQEYLEIIAVLHRSMAPANHLEDRNRQ